MNATDAAHIRDEPLVLSIWLKELQRLGNDVNGIAGEADCARLLRRAFHLSQLAPDPFHAVVTALQSEAEFEAGLQTDGVELSARKLIGANLELQLAKPDGHFCAAVRSPDFPVSGHFAAKSLATGIIGAWINCILALAEGAKDARPVITDRHISLSGLRPPSIRH